MSTDSSSTSSSARARPTPSAPTEPAGDTIASSRAEDEPAPHDEHTSGTGRAPTKPVSPTRAGAVWVAAVVAAVVVIALVIFIAQNSQKVSIHFLGLSGHFSLALALLVAAVGGVLLAAVPGTLRILQLRHAVKKTAQTAARTTRPGE